MTWILFRCASICACSSASLRGLLEEAAEEATAEVGRPVAAMDGAPTCTAPDVGGCSICSNSKDRERVRNSKKVTEPRLVFAVMYTIQNADRFGFNFYPFRVSDL